MKLKSYFSGTVEAAMMLARREMGEEALLVNARPASPESKYLGAYEVVFGLPDPEKTTPAAAVPPQTAVTGRPATEIEKAPELLARKVASLRQEIERMAASLADPSEVAAPTIENSAEPPQTLPDCKVDPTLGRQGIKRALVALVGPPGSGKTTSLAKLAACYGLALKKSTHILSADNLRIAAAEQLRNIASLMGIGFDLARTEAGLDLAIAKQAQTDLVLIDTPGLAPADFEDAQELSDLIASYPEMDTHLVLPASMNLADMERIADQYQSFGLRKVLFTHLDETGEYDNLIRFSAHTGLALSFFAQGQRIPDDIELSSKERLMQLSLQRPSTKAIPGGLAPVKTLRKGAAA